nr:hypothetical protein [Candidatus Sigynarchaeota archaeon]
EIIAEIQMLRADEILIPIDIDAMEKRKAATQQDIAAIQQRVSTITFLSPEEKAKLVHDLAEMNPEEREATLSSMMIMGQLQSTTSQAVRGPTAGGPPGAPGPKLKLNFPEATVASKVSVDLTKIQNKKAAVKTVKDLQKKAEMNLKNFQYQDAIRFYEAAEIVTNEWQLKDLESEVIHEKIDATTKEIQYKQVVVVGEAKAAEASGDKQTAITKYKEAANLSSQLFKLGMQNEDKNVREYMKKAELLRRS